MIKRLPKKKALCLVVAIALAITIFVSFRIIAIDIFLSNQGNILLTKLNGVCGLKACNPVKDDVINVHIVAHTHDDVGWIKTEEMYYDDQVKNILDSVVEALSKNLDRRFIYVETAFFWKWWINQSDETKELVKKLVSAGRLEFAGGGWSMNDEATVNYQSVIDQFTWGLRRLNDTFYTCGIPKVAWQIDPFGHSREMASIFAQLGFDGLFFARLDYQDKNKRLDDKTLEMIWKGSDDLGKKADILTGALYHHYSPPPGYCFDQLCYDSEIENDDIDRLQGFFDFVDEASSHYATNNVLITMGDDFHYVDADKWFRNLDKLIELSNKYDGTKYNVMYSTPLCYAKAVLDESQRKGQNLQTKSDDFFPYGSNDMAYWTGYFTSRPTLKRFERIGNNYLQVSKQLLSISNQGVENGDKLNTLREAMGVLQHHDAIAGTEKEFVAYDYAKQLSEGIDDCHDVTSAALNILVNKNSTDPKEDITFSSCLLSNISSCPITENSKKFVVTIYNPLSQSVDHFVRFPVLDEAYIVTDFEGKEIEIELLPIPDFVKSIPGRTSKAEVDLIFKAVNIPPFGIKSYYVEAIEGDNVLRPIDSTVHELGNVKLEQDPDTGLVSSITFNNLTLPIKQQYLYYDGSIDNYQNSGAYVFRPADNNAAKTSLKVESVVYHGNLVIEIQQKSSYWMSQTIRIYKEENFVEFDWVAGPIPSDSGFGKEIISRFTTNLNSNKTFYTDSNGRQSLERKKNFRPTWDLSSDEPVSSNYYPVTSKIAIRDESRNLEVAILTDRAEGGSSLRDGQMELMIHRRCMKDDGLGVGEALNEQAFGTGLVAKGSHFLVAGPANDSNSILVYERQLAQKKLLSPWTFFSKTKNSFETHKDKFNMMFSGLKENLPENIQILTLEPWKDGTILLRLEHILGKGDDPNTKPETIDVTNLFSTFTITSIQETTLGANQWLEDSYRLLNVETENTKGLEEVSVDKLTSITLKPSEIRTFIIEVDFLN